MDQPPQPSLLTAVSEVGEFGLIARMRAALGRKKIRIWGVKD